MIHTPTLIVGAGPAGLAVAGRLRALDLDFLVIERGRKIAAAWHQHYDRLHLHTVKGLSHLPGLPFPAEYPRYVPRALLVEYYEEYASRFRIEPLFQEEAVEFKRVDGGWITATRRGSQVASRHVVLATGVNRVPNRPELPGEERFGGSVIHSRAYRNHEPFVDSRVLVVGLGNTGAEIALDLCQSGVSVAISVRGPVNIVPRDVLGRPTQLTALALARLPVRLGNHLGVLLRKLTVGDLSRYGIPTPDIPPIEQLRLYGKTPVIDLGTVARIKSGDIAVYGAIERLEPDGVRFENGQAHPFDAIILATGYRPVIEDLLGDVSGLLDRNGAPGVVVGHGKYEGLFFTGFDNYQAGGILGTIMTESEMIANTIASESPASD